MEQRLFGPTGAKVPVIGQGTWYIDEENRKQAIAAIREGLDLGMKHIDTAGMYGFGEAENIVGEAIEGRRDEVPSIPATLARQFCDPQGFETGARNGECFRW